MKTLWKTLSTLALVSTFAGADVKVSLIGKDARNKGKRFQLDQAELTIELAGPVVLTSWQMRFRNDQTIEAEGELNVNLRPGCHVVGYAMDVNGRIREGVVVDAKRARRAYEEIVRKKVDPGILEKSATGFSTKVYPLPANGAKTVRIDLAEIRPDTAWKAHLPATNDFLTTFTIVCHDTQAPKLSDPSLSWKRENGTWVVRGNHFLKRLAKLAITPASKPQTWVVTTHADKAQVVGKIPIQKTTHQRQKPTHIELWWDGSLAGRNRNHEALVKSLQALFTWVQKAEITLKVIRNTTTQQQTYQVVNGKCAALLTRLKTEPAAGMARFDQLKTPAKDAMALVVSEGLTPLPNLLPQFSPETSWCLLDPSGNNGHTLGLQALTTGNELRTPDNLNWQTQSTLKNLANLGKKQQIKKSGNHWIITAEIHTKDLYSLQGGVAHSPAARPVWAMETYRHMILTDQPSQQTLDFAKQQKVLTKRTAFIVLDSINDYVTYEIEPPEKDMRHAWQDKMAAKKKRHADTLFKWTTEWRVWHKNFQKTPPDFGKRLTKSLGNTSAFWAKHIGDGEKQVTPEQMIHMVKLQAEVDQITKSKPSRDRLKNLANAQAKWEKLRNTTNKRIGIIRVTIGGFVRNPGAKECPRGSNLADILELAGGPTPFASVRRVALLRNGRRYVYDFKKPEHRSIILHDGDSINVPQKGPFGNGGGQPGAPAPFESALEKGWIKASITQGKWSSDRPYVKVLEAILASNTNWKPTYQAQAKVYGWRADYYLDVIDLLENKGMKKEALKIAGNVAQLSVDSPELLRRAARAIDRLGDTTTAKLLYQRITRLAKNEPTSWIDMARWHSKNKDYPKAIQCYAVVTERTWKPHWRPAWTSAMIELNALLNQQGKALANGHINGARRTPFSADLRIILDWDAARSNVDLWVTEPLDTTLGWGNRHSDSGGNIPANAIAGYGPEEYLIRHAMPGTYHIKGKFHGDWTHSNNSTITVEARIITNFGRKNQTTRHISLRIPEHKLLDFAKVKWQIPD